MTDGSTAARPALLLILSAPDPERLRAALMLASAEAALGGHATLFLLLDAVALLQPPLAAPRDTAHAAAGLPTLAALFDDALHIGVRVVACQSGLALAEMSLNELPAGIAVGGPLGVLADCSAQTRLVCV